MKQATVIGAGLAGCESALQLAERGIAVTLIEQKPHSMSPAHQSEHFAELVCSNSFKAERIDSAAGLLKWEITQMGSVCMAATEQCRVPAGGSLSVDRARFSALVTERVRTHPLITVQERQARQIPNEGVCVVAAGPLMSDALAAHIQTRLGRQHLSFFDAAAPIVLADSIDPMRSFAASRYGKGGDDYLNCPMNREEYETVYHALTTAERAPLHDVDRAAVYEGCIPVELLAARGVDTLRYGPMKPVGLRDPATGHRPWAVVQLRKENAAATLYNLVGFQTNLKFSEQKRVFGLIPALKNAEYVRYGVMHRNTFLDSPRLLEATCSLRQDPRLFFAGQITGVEGYMESAASGILAGINAAAQLLNEAPFVPPATTVIGSLKRYMSDPSVQNFQPMGANFGILPPLEPPVRDKRARYAALSQRAQSDLHSALRSSRLFGPSVWNKALDSRP